MSCGLPGGLGPEDPGSWIRGFCTQPCAALPAGSRARKVRFVAISRVGIALAIVTMTGVAGIAGCKPTTTTGTDSDAAPKGSAGSALAAVNDLTVKGRGPKTGYSRAQFGNSWVDTDHNSCDTRDDILKRDLTAESFRADQGGDCIVASGTLADPYTGTTIRFTRGKSTVDIDHVVALSDAWQKGAKQWTRDKREQLANDPLNLLAVDYSSNRIKGDADAATWLPSNKAFRCAYVARQAAVKKKYAVWVTAAEKTAMVKVLDTCPGEPLPDSGKPVASSGSGAPATQTSAPAAAATQYANCDAVRKAGAAPLHSGDPGYSRALDRDGDGVACAS